MNTLREHEAASRKWFAITESGLVCIGDCGDYEAADEIACDLGLAWHWLISPDEAQQMANLFAEKGITGD